VHRAAEVELDLACGEPLGNRPGVGQRAGEAVELGDDEFIAGAAGRERFTQARSGAAGPVKPWST
jgi:hypothetical protein